jgi:hypothetical protein
MNDEASYENFDKEIESLLSLLKEYAEKLRNRSVDWLSRRARVQRDSLSALILFFLLFAVGFAGLENSASSDNYVSIGAKIAIAMSLLGVLVNFILRKMLHRQLSLEADDIAMLVNVIEKLVRRSSQIEDHGPMNFTNQIALDLRLAEAEAALRLANSIAREA